MGSNRLTLAVAGSRKTQGVVEHCASSHSERRILVLTYTQANQAELCERLNHYAGDRHGVEVMGWFSFLLTHFARPFLPFKFPGKRVLGFNFEGRPHIKAKGESRFLDKKGAVYASELGRLAHELVAQSKGALLRRLECIYDEILIDEVQDLSSHDWEIFDVLLRSSIDIRMVGDIRQSVLATNPRSKKNSKYSYANSIMWFRERETEGLLKVEESRTTWRCHPSIASFSDTIFDPSWSFPATESKNETVTGHDGVHLLATKHVEAYVARYQPQCLRHSVASAKGFDYAFMNFKVSKGMTFERVLIFPTAPITKFITGGTFLEATPASSFYVAVTRAKQSVAIVLDDAGRSTLPFWRSDESGED
ncbi:UvrD-helicase domain-containing protein [Eoetvoesiella caeni]|uniref:UvrD/REP helicase N-terminal domain-containing protein n=1 Tax=Eoetvoesiella caeni TaxID=645616 RepID=A0A366HE11_9BURK|nr:UvrD-helicase domain-containing protein [Eoetvoesiella caeni]MCI2808938.1 UvrD-helicase domain-containing protein [Eoetvoesiella caeni]NYT55561.1 UvrD-helicase domain-containing protein [Eoetvoesiella caeni]RBP40116.1 UvrD/REP helicase N-terminal domain-containing protein [Eoetvoesiella caeni]